VSRVLTRAGLSRLSDLEPSAPVVRYEHAAPWDLIHIDTKKIGRIGKMGHRAAACSAHGCSVRTAIHSPNDNVHFCMLILNIEDVITDAIVTSVSDIFHGCSKLSLIPDDREFCRWPGVNCNSLHDASSRAKCQQV
jgi:hypothetical protein